METKPSELITVKVATVEIRKLKSRIKELEEEKDILKKAITIFAKG